MDNNDNNSSNKAVVEAAYAAFAAGDIPTLLGLLADDVSWTVPRTLPQGGTFSGPAGVTQFFQGLGAAWSPLDLQLEAVGALDGGLVIGIARGDGQLADGTSSGYGAVHVFTVRDGKIASFREFTDLDAPLG